MQGWQGGPSPWEQELATGLQAREPFSKHWVSWEASVPISQAHRCSLQHVCWDQPPLHRPHFRCAVTRGCKRQLAPASGCSVPACFTRLWRREIMLLVNRQAMLRLSLHCLLSDDTQWLGAAGNGAVRARTWPETSATPRCHRAPRAAGGRGVSRPEARGVKPGWWFIALAQKRSYSPRV